MSLVETLVGVAAGAVLGLASSVVAQSRLLKTQRSEMVKERVYSPLYDEPSTATEELARNDRPSADEWD